MVAHASRPRVWTARLARKRKASRGAGPLTTEARRRRVPAGLCSRATATTTLTTEPACIARRRAKIRTLGSRYRRLAVERGRNRSRCNTVIFENGPDMAALPF
jgi:hypothetical protein